MNEILEAVAALVRDHSDLVWAVTILSAATFAGTLIAVPLLLTWIPADYFVSKPPQPARGWINCNPVVRVGTKVAKNVFGTAFVLAGLAMLVLPGQGLLTMLVGLALMDLPGKRKLEVSLLRRPHVHRAVDWLRRRANRPPLVLPPKPAGRDSHGRLRG
ncbi:MAG: PGPGW domain-containing protein [Planctomycetaceae bacterium]